MSIIYDALKKLERSNLKTLTETEKETKEPKKSRFPYFVFVLVGVTGLILMRLVFGLLVKAPVEKNIDNNSNKDRISIQSQSPSIIGKPLPEISQEKLKPQPSSYAFSRLRLSGIFSDGQKSYAIINNRILREGDSIEGSRLLRILSNSVELEFKGENFDLKIK